MRHLLSIIFCIIFFGFQSKISFAETIVFENKQAFLSSTQSSAATTIPSTPQTVFPFDQGFTSGNLSFSLVSEQSDQFAILPESNLLPGNELTISGLESFNIDFLEDGVFSFGFDFVEGGVASTFTISMIRDEVLLESVTMTRKPGSATFFGVWADSYFDRIEIRETGNNDNDLFGQFYTGFTPKKTIVFDNKQAFLSSTQSVEATSIPSTPLTVFPFDQGFTSGNLSFSLVAGQSDQFAILPESNLLPGNELTIAGLESFNVTIDSGGVFAFGFDFIESGLTLSNFEFSFFEGELLVDSFNFFRPPGAAQFVGVWTNEFFDRVEIRETGSDDNDLYGQFYIGTLSAVPTLGDINCDGLTNLLDVAPFIELLSQGEYQFEADVNSDGSVDLLDVEPFVELLSAG